MDLDTRYEEIASRRISGINYVGNLIYHTKKQFDKYIIYYPDCKKTDVKCSIYLTHSV